MVTSLLSRRKVYYHSNMFTLMVMSLLYGDKFTIMVISLLYGDKFTIMVISLLSW